ncbi:MAG TPA: hypothetical protein VJM11_04435 [Nevskiaceae bacterium]|nr:hypothetical protein [Nevskiaceae bacterium]
MSTRALDALRAEMGAAAARQLPPALADVPEPQLEALLGAIRESKRRQKRLLEDAADHSLRLVPALLRPAVRKVLFG